MVYCITQKNKDKGDWRLFLALVFVIGLVPGLTLLGAWLDLVWCLGLTWVGAWGSQRFKSASQTPLFSFGGVSHANFEIPIPFPSKFTDFHKKAGSFCTFLRIQTPASLFS